MNWYKKATEFDDISQLYELQKQYLEKERELLSKYNEMFDKEILKQYNQYRLERQRIDSMIDQKEQKNKLNKINQNKDRQIYLEKNDIRGEGASYSILVNGTLIGHITGRYVGYGQNKSFSIENTQIDEFIRGTGVYQEAIIQLAKQYGNGLIIQKYQASPLLQKSVRKLDIATEDEDNIYIKV